MSKNWIRAAELALPFLLGFCLMWLAGGAVYGQGHQHPPQDQAIHERFYSNWMIPNDGSRRIHSCCNKQDCYPTRVRKGIGGGWEFERREDGAWIRIPDSLIEQNQSDPRESPDDRSHVCAQPPGHGDRVYCFTFGSGL